MSTILETLAKIEAARRAQEPLLAALRLYGELERAGLPPKAKTLKGGTLIPVINKTRRDHGIDRGRTGLISGVRLADGTVVKFPKPIQYP